MILTLPEAQLILFQTLGHAGADTAITREQWAAKYGSLKEPPLALPPLLLLVLTSVLVLVLVLVI